MREDQVTQRDLTKKAGLWNIKTYVWLGQLRYLGHLVVYLTTELKTYPFWLAT